jgi:hypothetical protein
MRKLLTILLALSVVGSVSIRGYAVERAIFVKPTEPCCSAFSSCAGIGCQQQLCLENCSGSMPALIGLTYPKTPKPVTWLAIQLSAVLATPYSAFRRLNITPSKSPAVQFDTLCSRQL